MKLALCKINIDNSTQVRVGLNAERVEQYAANYKAGVTMPDVVCFADGNDFWLGDGFHRCAGAKTAGLEEIGADVREGTRLDAILYSLTCNDKHGLPLSNADKRNGVRNVLLEKAWENRSDSWVAETVRVSDKLVAAVRADLKKEARKTSQDDGQKEDAGENNGSGSYGRTSSENSSQDGEQKEDKPKTRRRRSSSEKREGKDGKKYPARKARDPKKASKDAHDWFGKLIRYADSLASGKPKFEPMRKQFQTHLEAAKKALIQLERATEVK